VVQEVTLVIRAQQVTLVIPEVMVMAAAAAVVALAVEVAAVVMIMAPVAVAVIPVVTAGTVQAANLAAPAALAAHHMVAQAVMADVVAHRAVAIITPVAAVVAAVALA
jgi:hypothetical protein